MRSLSILVLGAFLLAGSAFAGCPLAESGEHAATLTEAAKALEGTNPDLAAKVKGIADNCCKPAAKAAASEHPSSGSEHPTEHPA
jgi:hypothetical protein